MERPEEYYTVTDHTADLGIIITGPTLPRLFVHGGKALFHILTGLQRVTPASGYALEVEGRDLEDLMVRWLGELLFLHETEDLIFSEFFIEEIDHASLRAQLRGEVFDPKRHEILREIKAVTYHDVEVKESDAGWQARVLFDI